MLKTGRNKSPNAKTSGHETQLRQKHHSTTFWWNEKKPQGGPVNKDGANTRGGSISNPKTIGPRVA